MTEGNEPQPDPPWFILVQACIENNHTATPIEVKPGEGDSKLAPWVFMCRATAKPTGVRRGKKVVNTPPKVYTGGVWCAFCKALTGRSMTQKF